MFVSPFFTAANSSQVVKIDTCVRAHTAFHGSLCLVLALKEATQTPFLALDEFDVFMDERNRKVSLMTLVQVLKSVLCTVYCVVVMQICGNCVVRSHLFGVVNMGLENGKPWCAWEDSRMMTVWMAGTQESWRLADHHHLAALARCD
jgi:hypothetical protein